MDIDIERILKEVEADYSPNYNLDEEIFIDEAYANGDNIPSEREMRISAGLPVPQHDGTKSFNISVESLDKGHLIQKVKKHHPDDIVDTIYLCPFGNYFVTDMNVIYSIKNYITEDDLVEYKKAAALVMEKNTSDNIKERQCEILRKSYLSKRKYIYKKLTKESSLKINLHRDDIGPMSALGYEIKSDISLYKAYNKKTGEMENYRYWYTRINREAFIQMCKYRRAIPKGKILKGDKLVAIKRGAKPKTITIIYKGKEKVYESQKQLAAAFKVSLDTVKRKMSHAKEGEEVTIKRGVKFTISSK